MMELNAQKRAQQRMQELDRERKTPIIHMQFDEAACNSLYDTYASKFVKKEVLERRNPVKYMKNPAQVFGQTQGVMQYTWKDDPERRLKSIINDSANDFFSSTQMQSSKRSPLANIATQQSFMKTDMRKKSVQPTLLPEISDFSKIEAHNLVRLQSLGQD
jgi:hypothetical protein